MENDLRSVSRHNRRRHLAAAAAIDMGGSKAKTPGPELCLQMLISPSLQWGHMTESMVRYRRSPALSLVQLMHAWQLYLETVASDAALSRASPLAATDRALATLGRTHIIGAEADVVADDARMYVSRIQQVGGNATLTLYKGVPHGFWGDARYAGGSEALEEAVDALRRACPRSTSGSREAAEAAATVQTGTEAYQDKHVKREHFREEIRAQLSGSRGGR